MLDKKIYQLSLSRGNVSPDEYEKIINPIEALVQTVYSLFEIDLMEIPFRKLSTYQLDKSTNRMPLSSQVAVKLNVNCFRGPTEINLIHFIINEQIFKLDDPYELMMAYIEAAVEVPLIFSLYMPGEGFRTIFDSYLNADGRVIDADGFKNAYHDIVRLCSDAIRSSIIALFDGKASRPSAAQSSALGALRILTENMCENTDFKRYLNPTYRRVKAVRFNMQELQNEINKSRQLEYGNPEKSIRDQLEALRQINPQLASEQEEIINKILTKENPMLYSDHEKSRKHNAYASRQHLRQNPNTDKGISSEQRDQLKSILNRMDNRFFEQISIFDFYYQDAIAILLTKGPLSPNDLMNEVVIASNYDLKAPKEEALKDDSLISFAANLDKAPGVQSRVRSSAYWVLGGINSKIFQKDAKGLIHIADDIEYAMLMLAIRLELIATPKSMQVEKSISFKDIAAMFKVKSSVRSIRKAAKYARAKKLMPGTITRSVPQLVAVDGVVTNLSAVDDALLYEKEWQETNLNMLQSTLKTQEQNAQRVARETSSVEATLQPIAAKGLRDQIPLRNILLAKLDSLRIEANTIRGEIANLKDSVEATSEALRATEAAIAGRANAATALEAIADKIEEKAAKQAKPKAKSAGSQDELLVIFGVTPSTASATSKSANTGLSPQEALKVDILRTVSRDSELYAKIIKAIGSSGGRPLSQIANYIGVEYLDTYILLMITGKAGLTRKSSDAREFINAQYTLTSKGRSVLYSDELEAEAKAAISQVLKSKNEDGLNEIIQAYLNFGQ